MNGSNSRLRQRRLIVGSLAAGLVRSLARSLAGTAAVIGSGQALAATPPSDPDEERWQTLARHYFADRPIGDGTALLELEAPKRAHDAALVPITVRALDSSRPVHRLHLIVDKNPLPLAGIVEFADAARDWTSLETRIRINEYTHVRVVGELADGSLHRVSRFVKAAGGCSAPAMADMAAATANAGRMKALFGRPADALPSSPLNEAVIKISHPNNSGMQFDQVSRHYIPAWFVDTIEAEVDGRPLFSVKTNFSMSENPVVHLRYRPAAGQAAGQAADQAADDATGATAAGTLRVTATDSRGNGYGQSSGS